MSKKQNEKVDLYKSILSRPFNVINLVDNDDRNMILYIESTMSTNKKGSDSVYKRVFPARYKASIKVIDPDKASKEIFVKFSKILRMINNSVSVSAQKIMLASFVNSNPTVIGVMTEDHLDSNMFRIKNGV